MVIQYYLTDAGREVALSAAILGLEVSLAHIGVGSAKYDPLTALGNTTLVNEIARFPLNGGGVEPNSKTLRFVTSIEPTITADGFEIGIFTSTGVLFAIASTTTNVPLIRLVANIVTISTFGMILSTITLTNILIAIDPNTPVCVALMNQHLDHPDPHPQYATKIDLSNEADARNVSDNLLNDKIDLKYDKAGGTISGNARLDGNLNKVNGTLIAKDFAVHGNGVDQSLGMTISTQAGYAGFHNTDVNGAIDPNSMFSFAGRVFFGSTFSNSPGPNSFGRSTSLPNGFIMQFGFVASGDMTPFSGSSTGEKFFNLTFPQQFPNACLSGQATICLQSVDQNNDTWAQVGNITNNGMTLVSQTPDPDSGSFKAFSGIFWQAIGF
ncbi:phage tail protein [Acinetobacter baumannii]|nr:phage tail protein [Acinetobacter baumannii]